MSNIWYSVTLWRVFYFCLKDYLFFLKFLNRSLVKRKFHWRKHFYYPHKTGTHWKALMDSNNDHLKSLKTNYTTHQDDTCISQEYNFRIYTSHGFITYTRVLTVPQNQTSYRFLITDETLKFFQFQWMGFTFNENPCFQRLLGLMLTPDFKWTLYIQSFVKNTGKMVVFHSSVSGSAWFFSVIFYSCKY